MNYILGAALLAMLVWQSMSQWYLRVVMIDLAEEVTELYTVLSRIEQKGTKGEDGRQIIRTVETDRKARDW